MKILSAEACNYAKFPKLKIQYDEQGIVLIEGENRDSQLSTSNGAGKTSGIRDMLLVGLYGKTGEGKNIESRMLDLNGEICKIKINFVGNDGQAYRIEREFSKNKSKSINLYNGHSDNPIPTHDAKDAQLKIDTLLGGDFLSMVNTCIPSSENAFAEGKESDQKQILDSLLAIDKIRRALQFARDNLKELDGSISQLDYQLGTVKQILDSHADALQSARRAKQEADVIKLTKMNRIRDQITQVSIDLEMLETQRVQLIKEQDEGKTNVDVQDLKDSIVYHNNELLNTEREKAQQHGQLTNIQELIKQLQEKKEKIFQGKIEGTTCNHCGSVVNINNLHKLTQGWDSEIEVLTKEYKDSFTNYKTFDERIDILTDSYNKTRKELEVLTTLQEQNRLLNLKMAMLLQEISLKKESMDRLKANLTEVENEKSDVDGLIIQLEQKIKEEIQKLTSLALGLKQFKHKHKLYSFWEDAFGAGKKGISIPIYLYNSAVIRINVKLQKYIELLYGSNIRVLLKTVKESSKGDVKYGLNIEIDNLYGAKTYDLNSKGERKRINLALTFSILELAREINNIQPNLLILDEIDNNLDDGGIAALIQVLYGLKKDIPSIFVITHKTELKDKFSNSWLIRKQGGVSELLNNIKRVALTNG